MGALENNIISNFWA